MSRTGMPARAISVMLACVLACTMTPATPLAFASGQDTDLSASQTTQDQAAQNDELLNTDVQNDTEDLSEPETAAVEIISTNIDLHNTQTVLASGNLFYALDFEAETAAVIGWSGKVPEGALTIPSQVASGTMTYKVTAVNNVPGGGSLN